MSGTPSYVDMRLVALRAADAVLAAIQATLALPDLFGERGNPYHYNPEDEANCRVWVCHDYSRAEFERKGSRMLVTVNRMDYTPQELHQHNFGEGNFSDELDFRDLGLTTVLISCEGGNYTQAENLASICYQIIKMFRRDLMAEFDLHNIAVSSITTPAVVQGAEGNPWRCSIPVRIEAMERNHIVEDANALNRVDVIGRAKAAYEEMSQTEFTLDAE